MAVQTGDYIGEYEVLGQLGQGAFSHTYKATTRDGKLVVLKFPETALLGDPGVYERFKRELAIGQRVSDPGVPRALEIGDGQAGPYLVLEYVDGVPFRQYLRQHAPLPVDDSVRITVQLARALANVHKAGVYHRDLKPENLVISDDGTVHVIDFGIALLEGARRVTWRFLSDAMGTPDYMAPEQIQGKRGDARTDVYALGIMLYEMLTGSVPYPGDNVLAVMNQHLNATPRPPHELNRAVPPPVEGIVLKAIRKDPDQRYQSAGALADDLSNYHDLDLAQFVFEPERSARMPYSDRAIWMLSAGIGIGFVVCAALVVVIVFAIKHL
jgi:serine/threonine protein kinase